MAYLPIDVLDENGLKTGQISNIQEVHDKGYWHRTAHLWIVNLEGQILLQRRSELVVNHPNCLDTSTSGHVDAGEDGGDAAVRESFEELHLVLNKEELVKIHEIKNFGEDAIPGRFNFEFVDIFLLRRDVDIDTLVLDPHEVSGLVYMDLKDFEQLVASRSETLSPHWMEYMFLIDYLKANS
jgi:isopentenyl-diphosphate Delta-isomerase